MTQRISEQPSNDLGEMEGDEDFSFPPAERRVITQPVDLSVQTLSEQWESSILLLPSIQREYVWDNGKASRLIESLLLNIPIPVLYFAETADAKYEIIDGHQRVRSIVRFLKNEFRLSALGVLGDYKTLRFHQLPEREQRFMRMRTLRAIIVSIDSHPNMKFEIFERLNTGAISLNAQELRNSLYRGSLNALLHELARYQPFRALIGTKYPRRRMVDEELILRFLALRVGLKSYRTPLKRFLNSYMAMGKDLSTQELESLRSTFQTTTTTVVKYLGQSAFRVMDSKGKPLESSVNRALFDAQMLAFSWVADQQKAADQLRVKQELSLMFEDEALLDAIQRATGDRARTLKRLRDTVSALGRAGLRLSVPYDLTK